MNLNELIELLLKIKDEIGRGDVPVMVSEPDKSFVANAWSVNGQHGPFVHIETE